MLSQVSVSGASPSDQRGGDPDLPRLLPRPSAAVLEAGPPPLPRDGGGFGFEVLEADSEGAATVAAWMNLPHLAVAWESAHPESRWRRRVAAQRRGTYSLPLLVRLHTPAAAPDAAPTSAAGRPIAYVELYRPARDVIAPSYDAEPHDLGFHIAIGDPADIREGFGSRLLGHVAAELFAADPHCRRLIVEPDHRNVAARAAAIRLGAVFGGVHALPDRTFALYAFGRTAADGIAPRPDLLVSDRDEVAATGITAG